MGLVLTDRKLEGKVAVITGAASGIGRTTAVLFADEGARVLVADIDCGGGKETVHQIRTRGKEAVFVETDVTNENQVRHMINESVKEYGGVDVLFNGVGGSIPGGVALSDLTEEQWDRVFGINLKSVFFCSRNAFLIMKKGGGSIINVSSISVFSLRPDSGPYAVSKAGVIYLTRIFAAEGAPYNIRVNCVVPSEIDTPLLRRDWMARYGSYKPVTSGSLAYRIGRTEEVARTALFLASADSSWVSGANIEVSGAKHIPSCAKQRAQN